MILSRRSKSAEITERRHRRSRGAKGSPPTLQSERRAKRPSFTTFVIICLIALYFLVLSFSVSSFEIEFAESFAKELPGLSREERIRHSNKETPIKANDDGRHSPKAKWDLNIVKAQQILDEFGPARIRKIVTAYIEQPLNDTIPGTGSQGDVENDKDIGRPPKFYMPLPLRTTTPEDLLKFEYPKLQTCADVPAKIPVDRGLEIDTEGFSIVRNVGGEPTPDNYDILEALFCPVEADPFLPWIHDIFPSVDGSSIEFIAQNKRRCKTGRKHLKDVKRLEPQAALLQPISVRRIDDEEAQRLAPELWHPKFKASKTPRYRLAPHEEASGDALFTRFICRFHTTDFTQDQPRSLIIGETLSTYPFNYEFVSFRKDAPQVLTPKGKDAHMFWTSNLRFSCPVPDEWKDRVAAGSTILNDGTPTLHVDVVPIRTSPRYGTHEVHFTEELAGPKFSWTGRKRDKFRAGSNGIEAVGFDPRLRWGDRHVLPLIEASGRWENFPICQPPQLAIKNDEHKVEEHPKAPAKAASAEPQVKPHLLSACLWASESFKTRGKGKDSQSTRDTRERLAEWIEFHLMVGFDHIYVYDNSGAHSNETSLADVIDNYPSSQVTRIDWPSLVCNNNIPAHDNTGERSSQYAAENSCRTRYAPYTEWMASIDADEYLVPMGNYTNLRDVVRDAGDQGTNILSFRSTRGKLRINSSKQVGSGVAKLENSSFLGAYNCDSSGTPKPSWADRARKQIYRTDYVLYHHVHYSTVTQGHLETYNQTLASNRKWIRRFREGKPSERVTDETNEAIMIHTKTTDEKLTHHYLKRCNYKSDKAAQKRGCFVGFNWPNDTEVPGGHDADGMEYNCFTNRKVENYWLPRLQQAIERRKTLS